MCAALSDIDEAVSLEPGSAAFIARRANLYRKAGRMDRALADYDAALKLEPNNAAPSPTAATHMRNRKTMRAPSPTTIRP